MAEAGTIWIFYKDVSIPKNKNIIIEKRYYYSTKGNGKLIELNIKNIKQTFPNNHLLHDAVDAQFQNSSISQYDSFHKMFKINHIISSTNNNYACPMHPTITGKEGDKCSKCGMDLEKIKEEK